MKNRKRIYYTEADKASAKNSLPMSFGAEDQPCIYIVATGELGRSIHCRASLLPVRTNIPSLKRQFFATSLPGNLTSSCVWRNALRLPALYRLAGRRRVAKCLQLGILSRTGALRRAEFLPFRNRWG